MCIDPTSSEWRSALNEKLQPENIRSTLMFSSLLQMVHEMIKRLVLHQVKSFYGFSEFDGIGWGDDKSSNERYEREVLSLDERSPFRASLLWLESCEGINSDESHRINEIYQHRHTLAHEIAVFIIDVDSNPDVQILLDAVTIMRKISRFWNEIEISLGTFDSFGNVDADSVHDGQSLVLDLCLSAYLEVADHGAG